MWAVRRASTHLRSRGLSSGTDRIWCVKSEIARWCLENYNAGITKPQEQLCDGLLSSTRFNKSKSSCSKSQREVRSFSFQAGASNSGQEDDDLEDGFSDVLLLMEKENIKPTIFTYKILVEVKGQSNDIIGMEQIVETLKAEGLEANTRIQTSLARYYAIGGLKDKAEAILKEMEGDDIKKRRWLRQCMAAIEAWGRLKRIENAEEAFDKLLERVKKPTSRHFAALMKVYADNNMLTKGKDLVKQMAESGCRVGPLTWDAVVKLYIGAGEVEKAESILEKAIKQKTGRPLFSSYLTIMDKYASRGDIHKAEKIFLMMRQAGYTAHHQQYQSLLQAYINANAPVYGFIDRMKADNFFPSKALANQLARADAFRKSASTELLE
ncbi:Pentatricopeptide repeat-containing protein, mitochondrial [Sesamum alatum]|uniref:Pentatricopeptide repeat-containing protein, mitochondrial n=1 Tax=Sesamum alatum TaxID=300844 RepID=A0AAE1XJ90_9LAMI|nr:Pentatricopeptide repeat-containing protein, mitochondrial [Sesamum alatum]